MALRVIGSGLGRTGTKSLQSALAMLGFDPCHHMVEVFGRPDHLAHWVEAGAGRPKWDAVFEGYEAAVDYPAASFWRELAAYYPEAKIIHTLRDPDEWFESTQATIFTPNSPALREMAEGESLMGAFFRAFIGPLQAHLHDRAYMTEYFQRHTEAVRDAAPPERLLVYDIRQGWAPLCAFLGVDVPDAAFPAENSRAEFISRRIASGRG